jgi:hypothetical protein
MGLMADIPIIRILAAKEFQDQLRILAKRYRQIRNDIQPLWDIGSSSSIQLES